MAHHNQQALCLLLQQHSTHHFARGRIQAGKRLIEQQQSARPEQKPRQCNAPRLPARHRRAVFAQAGLQTLRLRPRPIGQPHFFQHLPQCIIIGTGLA